MTHSKVAQQGCNSAMIVRSLTVVATWKSQKPMWYFNKITKIFNISFQILPNLNQEPRKKNADFAIILPFWPIQKISDFHW